MKIIRFTDQEYIPASHEDQINPEVWKKVLLKRDDLINGRLQMINWAKLPVGHAFKPHFHEDMEEVFIILKGETRIEIDHEQDELAAGDAVIIPMKYIHIMSNICDQDVEYLALGISTGSGTGKTVNV